LRGAAFWALIAGPALVCSGQQLGDDPFGPSPAAADAGCATEPSLCDAEASAPPGAQPDVSSPVVRPDGRVSSPPSPRPEQEDAAATVPPTEAGDLSPAVEDAATRPGRERDASSERPSETNRTDAALCTGNALSFDGTTTAVLDRSVQADFTLEAWIKTNVSNTGTHFWNARGIINADVSSLANDYATGVLNDRFVFGVGNPDITLFSTSVITTNTWVHVAATRRQRTGELQIIINGQLETSAISDNRGPLSDPHSIVLGANTGQANFIGAMDEVRIWELVRTPAEIAGTMHEQLTGSEPGLVGYWRFEDTESVSAKDSSPRRAVASLNGNPAWVASDALCVSGVGPP
jgi:hypothetical protein